jgi:N-acetylglucosaminyl-diphospho-decaprenol L-rhamnosyltransferase
MASDVTLVIITRNRRERLLRSLGRLEPGGPPVIVVDNGSSDGTAARVRERHPDMSVVRFAENRGSAARTAAVALASTEFVAFSDDDSWWQAGALARGVEALRADVRLGLVAARVLVGPEQRLDPASSEMRASPLALDPPLQGPRILGFVACAAICRRDAYLATGGFHPRYGVGGEEALLALELAHRGLACAYLDDVVAYHHPARISSDRASHRQRRRRVARNDLWTAWLRLPVGQALLRTAEITRGPEGRHGLLRALAGTLWVARERRPISALLARELRSLAAR